MLPLLKDNELPKCPRPAAPAKFDTPDKMAEAVDQYFKDCLGIPKFEETEFGEEQVGWIKEPKRPQRAALALTLGFPSVKQMMTFAYENDDYQAIIHFGMTMIEAYYEHRLDTRDKGTAGAIFALKQQGWRDVVDIDLQLKKSIPLLSWAEQEKK